jgi:hypothetical protein
MVHHGPSGKEALMHDGMRELFVVTLPVDVPGRVGWGVSTSDLELYERIGSSKLVPNHDLSAFTRYIAKDLTRELRKRLDWLTLYPDR